MFVIPVMLIPKLHHMKSYC